MHVESTAEDQESCIERKVQSSSMASPEQFAMCICLKPQFLISMGRCYRAQTKKPLDAIV